jgi:benzoyl-CoA reductase subunit B
MYSINILGSVMRSDQGETEQFWKMFRDEMKWRAENKIAALATERYRWLEWEPPPWTFLRYYRYMEEYGAVCVGGFYHYVNWEEQPDGTFIRPLTPVERGVPLDNREEVVRALALDRGESGSGIGWHGPAHDQYANRFISYIKHYRCNGAFLPFQRSGIGCVINMKELEIKLLEMGIPVGYYETSHPGNLTDFNHNRMLNILDTFMETQGLRKLVE